MHPQKEDNINNTCNVNVKLIKQTLLLKQFIGYITCGIVRTGPNMFTQICAIYQQDPV